MVPTFPRGPREAERLQPLHSKRNLLWARRNGKRKEHSRISCHSTARAGWLQPTPALVLGFAHLMLSVLRAKVLRGTDLAAATLSQIRPTLKMCQYQECRRIQELASAYPYQETFRRACANL